MRLYLHNAKKNVKFDCNGIHFLIGIYSRFYIEIEVVVVVSEHDYTYTMRAACIAAKTSNKDRSPVNATAPAAMPT